MTSPLDTESLQGLFWFDKLCLSILKAHDCIWYAMLLMQLTYLVLYQLNNLYFLRTDSKLSFYDF